MGRHSLTTHLGDPLWTVGLLASVVDRGASPHALRVKGGEGPRAAARGPDPRAHEGRRLKAVAADIVARRLHFDRDPM